MIEVAAPSLEQINECWGEISSLLQKAIDYSNGEIDVNILHQRINEGAVMVAVVFDSRKLVAVSTFEQIEFDTGKRVLNIQLAGGENVESWFEHIEALAYSLAKRYECDDVYIIGRKGWVKKMKHLGYSEVHTILHKEVH